MKRRIAAGLLSLMGWSITQEAPLPRRYVLACAPHTSLLDTPLLLLVATSLGIRMRWLLKAEAFRPPLRGVLRALGALPVERHAAQGLVHRLAQDFATHEPLVLAISPPGTRARREGWKMGFYAIAHTAQVPVVLGFLDYGRRRAGVGAPMRLTGDSKADMMKIQDFFQGMQGRWPERQTEVVPGRSPS